MKIHLSTISKVSILYLLFPLTLFLFYWIKPIISIPIIILLFYVFFKYNKDQKKETSDSLTLSSITFTIISLIIIGWVLFAGVGGFIWQNRWDHMFRNAIFQDLFTYDWPVINYQSKDPLLLCYYIGYWLPSAFIAKVFNSILIGYICQVIYAYIGIVLSFFLISFWLKKISYITILILILFSGLDIISMLLLNHDPLFSFKTIFDNIIKGEHLELYIYTFNSSSNTTLLFWLYNQSIPFWIGFMLILLQKDNKYLAYIYSLIFLFSPMPLIGITPLVIYLYAKNTKFGSFKEFVKNNFNIVNISSLLVLLVIAFFYKSNIAANSFSLIDINKSTIAKFILFMCVEFGIYILFIYNYIRKDTCFYILLTSTIIFSFFKLGDSYDFAWRTAVPLAFFIMLYVIKELLYSKNQIKKILLVIILAIGAITPLCEMLRTVNKMHENTEPYRETRLQSTFIDNYYYGNFIGDSNSIFYKYLLRK